MRISVLLLSFVVFFSSSVTCSYAQLIFRDDFDGSKSDQWTIIEGANDTGERKIVDGTYRWKPTTTGTINEFISNMPDNISIRTRFQLLEEPTSEIFVGIGGRDVIDFPAPDSGNYYRGITTANRVGVGISNDRIPGETRMELDAHAAPLDLRFDMLNDELKLWVWTARDEMPTEPIYATTDSQIASGENVFLSYRPLDGSLPLPTIAWDYVEVVAIPEPSLASFVLPTMLMLGFWNPTARPSSPAST